MKISCGDFDVKIISQEEYEAYYLLLEKNRSHLKSYFPKTTQSVQSIEDAQIQLSKICKKYLHKELYPFGVYKDYQLIGWISLKNIDWRIPKAELGYYLDKSFEGQGIISKGVKKVVHFAFNDLEMEKLFIRTGPENIGSQKIALKNGFVEEGILRSEFRLEDGKLIDTIYYGRVRK